MQLFCKYPDPQNPTKGFVMAWHDDDQAIDASAYPGCIIVSYAGHIEDLGKYGPAPVAPIPDMRHPAAPDLTPALAQDSQITVLTAACKAALLGGFQSAALGPIYTYPSTEIDQRNMSAKALWATHSAAGATTTMMCADSAKNWARRPHTDDQVLRVFSDFNVFHDAATAKLDALKAKVAIAQTPLAIAAVTWG